MNIYVVACKQIKQLKQAMFGINLTQKETDALLNELESLKEIIKSRNKDKYAIQT